MSTITTLEVQRRDPERINIYLDGHFAFGASAMLVMTRGLREGQELDEEDINELKGEDAVERAYTSALNFLSFRPRSRREIEQHFRRKGIDARTASGAVGRLQQAGLIDDREFARFWVENRQMFRPRASRALKMELRQKGLDTETIDEALSDIGDEDETAVDAGRKRLRSYASLDEEQFRRKMIGFLQRRGFVYETASRAASALVEERDSSPAVPGANSEALEL